MANSKNTNLFMKLYSTPSGYANVPFTCGNALDLSDTSADISNSELQITDSNGDIITSLDMSGIHAAGLTEYYTETKIIGPQSAYLLQGNVIGETYAAQFFAITPEIQHYENYEPFINLKFCINYVQCSTLCQQLIDTYKLRTQPQDVCEIIQAKFDSLGIPVAVSIRSLAPCNCEDMNCGKKDNPIDYLVFQSTQEGYQFFVYDVFVSAIDYSYENFNREWADYTESPFVGAVINFDTIIDLIRSSAPRLVGNATRPNYDRVPCDIYKYFVSIVPLAVDQADAFAHNYNALKEFAKCFNELGELIDSKYQMFVTLGHMYPDIYAYYFGMKDALLYKYNIHDIIAMLGQVSAYIHESNVVGPYKLVEDFEKRLYPQKYPNGAFRGIAIVPDYPDATEAGVEKFAALRLAHVSDSIIVEEKIELPEDMHIEGYICNGCKDVYIKHRAEVKVNTLLQEELEVYRKCDCALPIRKVVSNDGLNKAYEDDVWTSALHKKVDNSDLWTNSTHKTNDSIWSDYQEEDTQKPAENWDDEYVDDYRVPSKYDVLARVPGRYPKAVDDPKQTIVGLYGYMAYLCMNDMWTKCGSAYMCIGLEDDYQSKIKNLQNSVLIYNPNPVPIKISFIVFS